MIINHKMWNAGPVVVFPRRGSTLGHFGYDSVGSLGKILTSFVARWFLMFLSIVSTWLLQFVPSKVSTFSRIMHNIHLNCPHVIPNPFPILSHFSPIHNNSTDSPSCAGSLTSRSPICRCPRRNASSDRRRNRRNLLLCRRYRRPSWVGRWGRNHGQNGGGDQTTNEDGDIVPTLSYPS